MLKRVLLLTTVIGLISIGPMMSASANARATLRVSVRVVPTGQTLVVRVTAPERAKCSPKVSVKHTADSLPAGFTSKAGLVAYKWSVPPSAPSGTWAVSVRCTKSGATGSATTRFVMINHGSGTGAVTAADSVQLITGDLGGKGAGPCGALRAPDQNGNCISFPGDPFNFYKDPGAGDDVGQCTWYAAGRRPDLWNIATHDAKRWLADVSGRVPEGTVPVVGAIAVQTTGQWGHVAYVVGISGSNVIVDDANYRNDLTIRYAHAIPASDFQGYIYGGPAGTGPSSSSGGSSSGGGTGSGNSGSGGATNSGGSTVAEAAGILNDFYVGGDGTMRLWLWSGTSWVDQTLGGSVMAGTRPSAYAGANGSINVFYVGSDGTMRLWLWNGSSWQDQDLGGNVMSGTSPSAFPTANGGINDFYVGSDGTMRLWLWSGT
ncbi:MAG TPA: CHAP domain-containing protein, partial [Candidatus Acidoferrum sp.]|nr:CHAP domain-containing protein [Candidatus Acidoferrum sp.]